MLAKRLDLSEESNFTALGGAYLSSLGVTTERVYPLIGDASNLPRRIIDGLAFRRFSDVLAAAKQIADGRPPLAASRAGHLFAFAPGG